MMGRYFNVIFEALTLFAFVILKGNKYFRRIIVVTDMKFLYECSIFKIFNFYISVIYYLCKFTSLAECLFSLSELLIIHITKVCQYMYLGLRLPLFT